MRRMREIRIAYVFALQLWLLLGLALPAAANGPEIVDPAQLSIAFAREVAPRLDLPPAARERYAAQMESSLSAAGIVVLADQWIVVVDRNPNVQAAMIFWRSSTGEARLIGAGPASTGRHGGFEHFETPVGVFEHSLANPDFRAEGTENELGVRGYGAKGMRVYDFGWVEALRTWGTPRESRMRLQMHSTDPVLLEPGLGTTASKGCIRIGATLNVFIDRYAILDADYERALASGHKLWVLSPDRTPTPWSGRYLIVVDSGAARRPAWSPRPGLRKLACNA